jgi:hypothetical protein
MQKPQKPIDAATNPLPPVGKRGTVLIFVLRDCPIANQYAPEISRLCNEYQRAGFLFYVVYTDPEITEREAKQHAQEYRLTPKVWVDSGQALVRFVGATVTPEAAVYSPTGKRLYRGRIDNRYPRLGVRREVVTQHDLRQVLESVRVGKPVATPITQAVGCFIPKIASPNGAGR